MVWIPLENGSGQVVKQIRLFDPEASKEYIVESTSRKGINRYEILLRDTDNNIRKVFNYNISKKKNQKTPAWSIVGEWHSPEKLAIIYNRKKIDPDSNKPRPMRESFWKMKSKPGTHNYRQKIKLMQDPTYQKLFGKYFSTTITE